MESETDTLRVDFPEFPCSILEKLNQQRQRGQLCDIIVSIGGHQFRAHRAVLAASSPYFCDQVLLKNSARVVLPEVMTPWVFEGLLESCYTGSLSLAACEVVAFLTAASFLQMWHVVDKCTDLLESNPACAASSSSSVSRHLLHKTSSLSSRRGSGGSHHLSPDRGSHQGDSDGVGGSGGGGCRGSTDFEQLLEEGFSPQPLEPSAPSSPDREQTANGQNGGSRSIEDDDKEEEDDEEEEELPRTKPLYVPPSIMGFRKWSQVKAERPFRGENCRSHFTAETGSTDSEQLGSSSQHQQQGLSSSMDLTGDDSMDKKLVSQLEESLDCDPSFDDPLDFYGSSMDQFSGDKAGNFDFGRGGGGGGEEDEDGMDAEGQDETSNSVGAGSGYRCQCGKSFAQKSQRDRHMTMHLGLRPFGCSVCGKNFKMKHHLVGHMKTHTGVKPYECSMCSKRFAWKDTLNRHTASCKRSQGKRASAASAAATVVAASPSTAEQSVC